MKNTFRYLMACISCVVPMAWADMAITPQTVENMQKVFAGFELIEEQSSDLSDDDDASFFTSEGRAKIIAQISTSPQSGKALKLVKANGFDDLETYFDFVGRVFSASIALSFESNGVSDLDADMDEGMEKYMAELKQSAPPEMHAQMQKEIDERNKEAKEMRDAAKAAKPEDIAALKKHPEILKIMESE